MSNLQTAGLDEIRDTLEHHPPGAWRAIRTDGTGDVLTGLSPDDLAVLMRADWHQSWGTP